MRNTFVYCIIFTISVFIFNCNNAAQTTEGRLPADSMAPDVSETSKMIGVEAKNDSLVHPVENPK